MINYLFYALIGCLLGTVTGLTPGLHVNTIALIGLSLYPRLGLTPIEFAIAMVGMSVTHTFLDFIPSIYLGVPEEETALSVLPTHQLLLAGKAMEATKLTAYGSLLGLFYSIVFLIPALYLIPATYQCFREYIVYVLIAAVLLLILREKKKNKIIAASAILILSGVLGMLMFRQKILSTTEVLFPVFVGIFGLSNIINSLQNKQSQMVPQDKYIKVELDKNMLSSSLLGAIGGLLVGILPAMSPSQVGVLMYELMGSNIQRFIISVSAINTSDAIYSFISLYTINNPRSGVATMVGKVLLIDFNTLMLLVGVTAFVGFIATIIHIRIGEAALDLVERIDYRMLSALSMLVVLVLVYSLTGFMGLYAAFVATSIGLLPILSGVSRTHCMGVLIIPTALFFLGINI
ncbi:MAG: hypothetical protein B6U97_00280 [Candidatus Altiarchaeales archaeon ex4484_96]|nr:MAG: hypothetical protein B6U97_00280 [Candidatus Altiarchaeales archaeon ex4484_96]